MSYAFTLLMWSISLTAFAGVFTDRSWLPALAFAVLMPVTIEFVASRIETGRWLASQTTGAPLAQRSVVRIVSFGLHMLAFFAFMGLIAFPETLAAGIVPTPATVSAFWTNLFVTSGPLLRSSPAPLEPQPGFVVIAAATVWLAAGASSAAQWAADTPALGAVLPLTIFTFASVFAQADASPLGIGLLVISAAAMIIATDYERTRTRVRWMHAVTAGAVFGVAVIVGVAVAPQLPRWGDPPVLEYTNVVGTNVGDNPLVDIHPRLVDQSERTVFEVRGHERSYWRLTSLDEFDGRIWSSSDSAPELPQSLGAPGSPYQVVTTELSSPWLPVAPYPAYSGGASIDDATSAAVVPDGTEDGRLYEVASAPVNVDAAALDSAPRAQSAPSRDHYQRLEGVSEPVRAWAQDVTAGAPNAYRAALALQNELRSFTYSLEIDAGHGDDVLETFLYETRTGYCEQFSSAMAVLARSLGIPARVAVGYIGGVAKGESAFAVRGRDSHAWPELYFEGVGWVPFEPTPSRGELQASYLPDTTSGAPPPGAADPTTAGESNDTTDDAPNDAGGAGETQPQVVPAPVPTTAPAGEDESEGFFTSPLGVIVLTLTVIALAAPFALVAFKAARRGLRRRRGAAGAWLEARDRARDLGLAVQPGSTPAEVAEVCRRADLDIDSVAAAFTVAEFSPDADTDPLSTWTKLRESWRGYAYAHPGRALRAAISPASLRRPTVTEPATTRVTVRPKAGAGRS